MNDIFKVGMLKILLFFLHYAKQHIPEICYNVELNGLIIII